MTPWTRSGACRRSGRRLLSAPATAAGRRTWSSSSPSRFLADDVWPTIATVGQARFGENRVQEAMPKWLDLRARAAEIGKTIELHLIGPLQTNKAREAVETFDVIQTIDREKIAAALAEEIRKHGRSPRLFVEVNTGAEPQKGGRTAGGRGHVSGTLSADRYGLNDRRADVRSRRPAEQASPHFALLGEIARRNGLMELSMGMSADWPLAVQLGATLRAVRQRHLRCAR